MRAWLHPFCDGLPHTLAPDALLSMSDLVGALQLRPEELDAAITSGAAPAPSISRPGFRRWTAATVRAALQSRQSSALDSASEA